MNDQTYRDTAGVLRRVVSADELIAWAVEDAVLTLSDEQPEHFAFDVSLDQAMPNEHHAEAWLRSRLNDGDDDDTIDHVQPLDPQLHAYISAHRRALGAGIRAYEAGCVGEYDADDVTDVAIAAAQAARP
jgi:hypothetical protein